MILIRAFVIALFGFVLTVPLASGAFAMDLRSFWPWHQRPQPTSNSPIYFKFETFDVGPQPTIGPWRSTVDREMSERELRELLNYEMHNHAGLHKPFNLVMLSSVSILPPRSVAYHTREFSRGKGQALSFSRVPRTNFRKLERVDLVIHSVRGKSLGTFQFSKGEFEIFLKPPHTARLRVKRSRSLALLSFLQQFEEPSYASHTSLKFFADDNSAPSEMILNVIEEKPCVDALKKTVKWSGRRVSNPQPSAWEADTLPIELLPPEPDPS